MSIEARFSSHAEAKKNGWFSRRHEGNGPHQDAVMVRDVDLMLKKEREDEQLARATERKAKKLPKLAQDKPRS